MNKHQIITIFTQKLIIRYLFIYANLLNSIILFTQALSHWVLILFSATPLLRNCSLFQA